MILLYFLLNIVGSTISLFGSFALKYILDALASDTIQINICLIWILCYIVSLIMLQANNSIQNVIYNNMFQKAEHLYDCNIISKISELPLSIIDSSEGKNKIDDVNNAKNTVVYAAYRLIRVISLFYTFVVAYVTLLKFDVYFSIIFLILTIPGIILNQLFDKKFERLRLDRAPDIRKFCYYRWMLTDAWPAKDVRMYDLTEPIKYRYNEEKQKYLNENKKLDKKKMFNFLIAEIIRRSGEIVFIAFVVYQAIEKRISVGDVGLYIGLAVTSTNLFQNIFFNIVMSFTRTTEITSRVFDFFNINVKKASEKYRSLENFETLKFDNVFFKYPFTEEYILKGVSFEISKGDKVSIIGKNGSGKSTMIKLMLGLYEIESGDILINGHSILDYNIQDVRKLFSVLFQDFVKYPLSLRENVALSYSDKLNDDREIENVLRQCEIYEEINSKLTKGFDSFMTRSFDDEGIELSKGQWQKIAIARVYFKKAEIVVLDEPTAAIDAETEEKIFNQFESISADKTGIMISHRISSARISNKIIVIDDGKIIENGTHEELIIKNGLYAKFYNLQKEKYLNKETNT